MPEKTIIPVRTDPDFTSPKFANNSRTIDIRGFFPTEGETPNSVEDIQPINDDETFADTKYIKGEEVEPLLPEVIVSQSYSTEKKRKEYIRNKKEDRERLLAWKYGIFRILLSIMKTFLVLLIEGYQKCERKLRAMEWGGINFDTKYDTKTIFFLSISLPSTIINVSDVLLCYPLISRKVAYQMLKIKKDHLASYERVFNKGK